MAYGKAGYRPELSYGSHMFQNLVRLTFTTERSTRTARQNLPPGDASACGQVTERLAGETAAELLRIVKVYDVRGLRYCIWMRRMAERCAGWRKQKEKEES